MAQAIITRRNSGGGGRVYTPVYTGNMSIVWTNEKQTGGYAEFTSSGTLTWIPEPPPEVDLFCVGGGGGAGNFSCYYRSAANDNVISTASGGGSGYTTTVKGTVLPESTEITIGAGSASNASPNGRLTGGTTSVGDLCSAAGGQSGASTGLGSSNALASQRAPGGSSGGTIVGTVGYSHNYQKFVGITTSPTQGATNGQGSNSQGRGTADLIGRVHAAGGTPYMTDTVKASATASSSMEYTIGPVATVSSDFPGGGYGAGGNVDNSLSACTGYNSLSRQGAAGGQGFAMIAWGSYKEDLGLT